MGNAKITPREPNKYFLPYQDAWIDDPSRLKLMEKSRQVGLSLSSSFSSVAKTAPQKTRFDHWVSSRDEIQAKLFLEDCKLFSGILDKAAKDLGLIILDQKKNKSAYVLEFSNERRIHSMSSNPDAQAGKRGGRTLDEFALHPDPKKLYSIAYPGITWGGQLEIISTHRGSHNFFNELVKDVRERGNPKGFSLHTVTLQDALDQGFLYKLQAVLPEDDERQYMDEALYFDFIRAGCAAEEQFLQEYMCQPADDNSAFLPYDLIASCEYHAAEKWELEQQETISELYMGVDIGRKHDLTVFWIVEKIGMVFFTRKIVELKNTPFTEQQRVFYNLIKLPGMRRVCGDESGLGMQLIEQAKEKYGNYKVEGVTFTGPMKESLAYPLRTAFEDGNIRVPMSDKIRADMRSIKKTITTAGNIRFDADRGPGGHADRFWAVALALHAGSTERTDFKITVAGEDRATLNMGSFLRRT